MAPAATASCARSWRSLDTPESGAPADVDAWRAARRRELLERRQALPLEERRAGDERVAHWLAQGFAFIEGLAIGFYWPFRGEVDPRVAAHRLRSRGSRTALPVVVAKGRPLEFREWQPGAATTPGPFGLPVPVDTPRVEPDVVLAPPVGFDGRGYRLGYGGGFFDRTLAAASPRPLAIGLAREMCRMPTIHPQPHDIPMDFIVTEDGIHAGGGEPLRRVSAEDAAGLARELVEARRRTS